MISETQLRRIVEIAAALPEEKRAAFMERIVGQAERRGRVFAEPDFEDVVRRATIGLIHHPLPA